MKGYKLWDPASRKMVYNQYLVFKEVGGTFGSKVVQTKKYPKNVRFELSNEEDDSNELIELVEEVEKLTPTLRGYE
jgi:hypothetical protein